MGLNDGEADPTLKDVPDDLEAPEVWHTVVSKKTQKLRRARDAQQGQSQGQHQAVSRDSSAGKGGHAKRPPRKELHSRGPGLTRGPQASQAENGNKGVTQEVGQPRKFSKPFNGTCYQCRGWGHRRFECATIVPRATHPEGEGMKKLATSTNAAPAVQITVPESASREASRGRKRERESTKDTPPAKQSRNMSPKSAPTQPQPEDRKKKRQFLYAEVAASSQELIIARMNGNHVSRREFNEITHKLVVDFIQRMKRGEWTPDFEAQDYNRKRAALTVLDNETAKYVVRIVPILCPELRAYTPTEHEEKMAERESILSLTGYVRGVTGKLANHILQCIINRQCQELQISGKLEVTGGDLTRNGKVLRIKVDAAAYDRLREINFTLRIALAGKVLFQDPRHSKVIIPPEDEEEDDDEDDMETTTTGAVDNTSRPTTPLQGESTTSDNKKQVGEKPKKLMQAVDELLGIKK